MQRSVSAVKLTDGLFLVQYELDKKNQKEVKVEKKLNHIFIYDRSGSMWGSLQTLCKDLKQRFRSVPKGDTITIGWFSGQGEFRFVLKGLVINGPDDFKTLDKVIDANSDTIGMTCFSEILGDTAEVLNDLKAHSDSFAVCFLTDGYPTTYPYDAEIKAINKAIDAIAGKVASSLLVGYSDYYNKELLGDMAKRFGGALIHSSDLKTFPIAYGDFMEKSRDSEGRIKIDLTPGLGKHTEAVFSLGSGGVNVYDVKDDAIMFAPTKAGVDRVYQIVSTKVAVDGDPDAESFIKGRYAAAFVLTQKVKTDKAVEILGKLGDVAMIDRTNNAFTNSEYGAAEQMMLEAIGNAKKRFLAGKNTKYLPKRNAFCLLDALDLMMEDDQCEFAPFHEAWDYKRIGPPAITRARENGEAYPLFVPDKESRVPMTGLVWNQDKLNLSIRAKISGEIDLGKDAKKVGMDPKFPTFVWRNYTLVKDGFLNVPALPVSLSKATYQRFVKEGLVEKEARHYKGRVYVLHLDQIPVMNRTMAEGLTSARALCEARWDEIGEMASLKVLNFLRNEIEPKEERDLGLSLSPEQEEFLKERGITRSGFNPPTDKAPTTDFYMAKCFDVAVKGFSSLPKVDEVRGKMNTGKKLTPSQEVIASALQAAEGALVGPRKNQLANLDQRIASHKAALAKVRGFIQRTKFVVILGKKWFSEFTSRENNVLTVDGREYTISVTEEKVEF